MQPLYLGEHNQFVEWNVIATAFQFLCHLLEHHQLPSYALDYISIKLGCGVNQSHAQLLTHTSALLNKRAPETGWLKNENLKSGTAVDHALRCVREVLRKGEPDREVSQLWFNWVGDLTALFADYNHRSYLVRMRAENYGDD